MVSDHLLEHKRSNGIVVKPINARSDFQSIKGQSGRGAIRNLHNILLDCNECARFTSVLPATLDDPSHPATLDDPSHPATLDDLSH